MAAKSSVSRLKSGAKNQINARHMTTSIGKSNNSNPKNKHKRRSWKPYKGQG